MLGEAAAIAAAVCWAVGSHLFGRIGRGGNVPPGALNLGKCGTAAVMFAATSLATTGHAAPPIPARPLPWLLASGVIGLALGDSAYFTAMALLGVRGALLLLSTAPVFAAVGGAIFLGESLGAREIAAMAMVMAGVAVVVNEQSSPAAPAITPRAVTKGVIFGLGAGLGQATGSLMTRFAMSVGVGAFDAAVTRLWSGLLAMIVLAALAGGLVPWARALARPRVIGAVGGSAFIGTYMGIWLSQVAIGQARSTAVAATLLATSPIFALPLGRWLNAERVTARALGGTVVAVGGLAFLTLVRS